ncbi:FAD/NAD(P)-binding protein [Singulisphaera sp. PoT]|uniref:FAD/NAD(P)-binding protein n=1 Tax=Singulisphaera sp. PoT TaxID=3411797 RepID=UPI003BF60470
MSLKAFPASNPHVVAVVGSGFSGTLVAVNLARKAEADGMRLHVVIFERGDRFARGIAYGTTCEKHLLNVPAGLMSALPDEPGHFLHWLQVRDPLAHAGTFAPRAFYGEYLGDLLAESAARAGMTIELVRDEVVDLRDEGPSAGVVVIGAGGSRLRADRAVLALGNPTPQDPFACPEGLKASGRYVSNSWSRRALAGLDPNDPIVLIGTGLSAVDLVLEAQARGHAGPITVLSRHGLLPFPHRPVTARPIAPMDGDRPASARSVLAYVRGEVERCEQEGGDWRSAVDALRPAIQGIWRSFAAAEKRRFIRHLGAFWEVHRHRVAPEVAKALDEARDGGQLRVVAGRIRSMEECGDGVRLGYTRRGHDAVETLDVRRVINCTGPSRDIRAGRSTLVDALISRGHCRPDPLSIGLEVSPSGAMIAADGEPSESLFAMGPILKGQLWETTAVRELRVQAAELATHLIDLSKQSAPIESSRVRGEDEVRAGVLSLKSLDRSA